MADELLPARDEEGGRRLYEDLTAAEQQAIYDDAAWDYINKLREMSPQQAAAHFKKVEWLERWQPEPAVHCPKCGDVVLELKWSADHTEWQCLEPTCRERWEWRKR